MTLNDQKQTKMLDTEAVHNGRLSKVERYRWADPTKPGNLSFVDKTLLVVDHKYQRDGNEAKITEIASKFNWPAFGVLVVARRGETLYVVDGQHRFLAAMKRADVRKVPCIVFESGGVEAEARTFLDAQTLRKPVTAVDKFKALLVCKDSCALAIQKLIDESGRKVAKGSSPSTIACVALLMRLYTTDPQTFTKLWPLLVKLCRGAPFQDRIIDAAFFLERHLPDGVSLMERRWTDRLLKIGPDRLLTQIHSASAFYASGGARVWADGILQLLNKGLAESARIELRRKSEAVEPGESAV
jgi:hypothetical protein